MDSDDNEGEERDEGGQAEGQQERLEEAGDEFNAREWGYDGCSLLAWLLQNLTRNESKVTLTN